MLLGDLGAEIIKVEMPETGDETRRFLPFKNNESGYYIYLNRNKKGITLDLKSSAGKEIALKLAQWADILVENFSPGTMAGLGLDYDEVRKVNPQIVYASISGFGQTGPLRQKGAYDAVVQAMGGLAGVTGFPDRPPVKTGPSIADANAGVHAAFGIVSAVYNRQKTGEGQYIDVSMMDALFSILENFVVLYTMTGVNPERAGNENLASAPFDTFPTQDDYVAIATANDRLFEKLAQAMEMPELCQDERFLTNPLRKANYAELRPIMIEWTRSRTTEEIVSLLDRCKVPAAPILSIRELVAHPQIKAREMLVEVDHPVAGRFDIPGFPVKLSATPGTVRTPAPLLGQHTDEVLRTIVGLSEQKIQELKATKVV
jgi:crotonobetainyl-CoA:carnitine CoA-transferase CaiB-like acyl-CoA transferase